MNNIRIVGCRRG